MARQWPLRSAGGLGLSARHVPRASWLLQPPVHPDGSMEQRALTAERRRLESPDPVDRLQCHVESRTLSDSVMDMKAVLLVTCTLLGKLEEISTVFYMYIRCKGYHITVYRAYKANLCTYVAISV